jgi:hypothetical protein
MDIYLCILQIANRIRITVAHIARGDSLSLAGLNTKEKLGTYGFCVRKEQLFGNI